MKSAILFVLLGLAIMVSVYFTYQRSFVWKNFEIINLEDSTGGENSNMQDDTNTNTPPAPQMEE